MQPTHLTTHGAFLLLEFAAEREEVLRHKWLESEKVHHDIGFDTALLHWMSNHHAAWLHHRALTQKVPSLPPQRESVDEMKTKILVVEDERGILEYLERALGDAGYTVQCAGDGRDGLRLFEQSAWDLVITDLCMPWMDGEEMARKIRAVSPKTPIILITGMVSAAIEPELFDTILEKPFRMSGLLAKIDSVLNSPTVVVVD
jgi:CheY-like chemotaxis protein